MVRQTIILLAAAAALLAGCAAPKPSVVVPTHLVRVTYFAGDSTTASGVRPRTNYTAAAPSCIPFHARIKLPIGQFIVEDRGTALESAMKRGQIRVDIFVPTAADVARMSHSLPEFMPAEVD